MLTGIVAYTIKVRLKDGFRLGHGRFDQNAPDAAETLSIRRKRFQSRNY